MLTVKLINEKTGRTRSVECAEVIADRVDGMSKVDMMKADGSIEAVGIRKLNDVTAESDYSVAYVENAQGRTIQTVRP